MRVIFELGHPAHVHLFKYTIWDLEKKGHEIKIAVREKEGMVSPLLEKYGFVYEMMRPNVQGMPRKAVTMIKNDLVLLKIARRFEPDIFVSVASPFSAHVSTVLGKPHICLTDTENAGLQLKLMVPFTRSILTPDCFLKQFPAKKHIRYPGYHELAYLHPNRFKPDPSVLDGMGIKKGEKYAVLRFGAFNASHDIGIKGFNKEDKKTLVRELSKYARVFVSSEEPLGDYFKKYESKIPIYKFHHALYYASLSLSDTGTMATEASILGTPAILMHPNALKLGNYRDLQNYGLTLVYTNPEREILTTAINILKDDKYKKIWKQRKKKLISEKIDVTSFLIWFIENYPESHKIYMEGGDALFKNFKGVNNG